MGHGDSSLESQVELTDLFACHSYFEILR